VILITAFPIYKLYEYLVIPSEAARISNKSVIPSERSLSLAKAECESRDLVLGFELCAAATSFMFTFSKAPPGALSTSE
jgi:hypothetical protein